jgi:hypothetical protein
MRRLSILLVAGLLAIPSLSATAGPAAADQSPPKVTVLERGDGPRTELRYALAAGDEQLVKLRVLTRIGQRVGNDPPRSGSSPAITFDLRSTVTAVAPDGVITATYVYEAVDVADDSAADAAVADEVRERIEPIVGLVGTLTMTDQGQVLTAEVAVPPAADPEVTSLVEQLSDQASALAVPLPTQAVGAGARWKATSSATVNGITLEQATVYEVESLRRGSVVLSSTLTQRAKRQTYTDPTTGEEVELLSSEGEGDGDSRVRLDQLLPLEADAHVQVRQELRADGTKISQTVTTHVFIEPA